MTGWITDKASVSLLVRNKLDACLYASFAIREFSRRVVDPISWEWELLPKLLSSQLFWPSVVFAKLSSMNVVWNNLGIPAERVKPTELPNWSRADSRTGQIRLKKKTSHIVVPHSPYSVDVKDRVLPFLVKHNVSTMILSSSRRSQIREY